MSGSSWLLGAFLVTASWQATAQTSTHYVWPFTLRADEVASHLETRVEPIYPDQAKADQIAGHVILTLDIDANGNVIHIFPLHGPVVLEEAARAAVLQWKYSPFEGDAAGQTVRSTVILAFRLPGVDSPADQSLTDAFFPLHEECMGLLNRAGQEQQAAGTCTRALALAEQLSPTVYSGDQSDAAADSAIAWMHAGDFRQALELASKAVTYAQQRPGDDFRLSSAYFTRGRVQEKLQALKEADQEMERAEACFNRFLKSLSNQDMLWALKSQRSAMLMEHAHVLFALGKSDQAWKKLDEGNR